MGSFSSFVRDNLSSYLDYIESEIRMVCTRIPKREPGSKGERIAAGYFSKVLKDDCGCSVVAKETFEEHPGAFYGWVVITHSLYLVAIGFFFFRPLVSMVLILLGYLIDNLEFVFYREAVDFLFPKKEGNNVTALRKAKGEPKRRILLNGHIDAAWEWPLNYRFGGAVFEAMALIPTIGAHYYFVLALLAYLGGGVSPTLRTLGFIGLLFVPLTLPIFFVRDRKRVVDGANDDLSGCYIAIALLKALEDSGIVLEDTDVGVVLTGSEEAGLRGAKAWAKKHKADFSDIPTYILSLDTIHDPRFLGVNTRDLNGTVRSDKELCSLVLEAAKEMGIPMVETMVPLMGGATDSAAFTQGGFRSVGITALNHRLEKYYHTRLDSWDNLDRKGLGNCLQVVSQVVEMLSQGSLD